MNRWRRPLLLIALLLLAGAVVNVGVAWGIAASASWTATGSADRSIESNSSWLGRVPVDWGEPYGGFWRHTVGWDYKVQFGETADERMGPFLMQVEAGFPWPAVRSTQCGLWGRRGERMMEGRLVQVGLPVPWRGEGARSRLPTDPLLPGFILNTFFYTGILALPLSVFPIRRRLRARRGRCPKCGYDLAGLASAAAACPECGVDGS